MSKADRIKDLLDEADRALRKAPRAERVTFWYKGAHYIARQTLFRILVDRPNGQPVACRWL